MLFAAIEVLRPLQNLDAFEQHVLDRIVLAGVLAGVIAGVLMIVGQVLTRPRGLP